MIAVMVGLGVVVLIWWGNVILGVAMCRYVVGCCVVALRFVVVAIGVTCDLWCIGLVLFYIFVLVIIAVLVWWLLLR